MHLIGLPRRGFSCSFWAFSSSFIALKVVLKLAILKIYRVLEIGKKKFDHC
jgi:hypothetical protein